MDLMTFEACLDRHGTDLAAWPPDLRDAAAALLATSGEAGAAHRALRDVEDVLRSPAPILVEAGAVAARAMRHRQDRPVRRAARRAGWAVAAVVALALGLFIGGVGPDHEEGPDHVMAASFDALGPSDVD